MGLSGGGVGVSWERLERSGTQGKSVKDGGQLQREAGRARILSGKLFPIPNFVHFWLAMTIIALCG